MKISDNYIKNVTVENGIVINYGLDNTFYQVTVNHAIFNIYEFGIFSSDPHILLCNSTSEKKVAIYSHNWCCPYIYWGPIENKNQAVYLTSYSEALLENVHFCWNNWDIYTISGSSAEAYDCIWSGDPEDYTYGDVYWEPSDWDDCGGLGKAVASGHENQTIQADLRKTGLSSGNDPGFGEYLEALEICRSIKQNMRLDFEAGKARDSQKYKTEYVSAIAKFKQVVNKYAEFPSAIRALGKIASCYRQIKQPQLMADYVNSIASENRFKALRPYALNALIPYHLDNKNYQEALKTADEILKDCPEDQLACEVLYGKGIIHKYYINDLAKAKDIFKMVISQYPDNPTALSAADELGDMGQEPPAKGLATTKEPSELSAQSYPNPFNPTTSIHFTLPDQGRIVLKIYDILGREVNTLVDEERPSGQYIVLWDGQNHLGQVVALGTYFYQIRFRDKIITRKITLMR